jgi:DNA-binding MarR family transcriptional regulator
VSIADLDPVIHAPKRLVAMAILANSTATGFGFLRDHLGVSDSDLSKQMAALDRAGYVTSTKTGRGRGSSTTYRITRAGRAAFERHIAALDAIVKTPEAGDQRQRR